MTCFGVLFSLSLSPVASKGFVSSLVKSLLFFLLLNVLAANAQTLSGVEQGIKPYGSYEGGDIDSVSMANGSLTLKIPLISYPQRGGKLHVGYSLYYSNPWLQPWASNCNDYTKHCDETGYDLVYYANPAGYGYVNPNGATFGTAMAAANDSVPSVGVVFESPNSNLVKYYTLTEPDGAVHDLGEVVVDGYAQYRSVDATGYLFVGTNSQYLNLGNLWDRHGNLYETTNGLASAEFQDSNGNQVTESATGWNDTMGRAIPGAPTSTTNLANCPASATTASVWSPPGPNGGTSQYKYCWATINISFTAPDCTSNLYCSPTSTTANEMVGLVLPNLTAWTFAYDSFGDITNITFPTGGSISYTWTYLYGLCVAPQFIDPASQYATQLWPYRRAVTSRTVNANDGTGSHTWTYVPSMTQANGSQEITGSFQTVVTDPLGNATVHSETALGGTCSIYETETQKYNGSTSGPVMQTVSTTYNYGSGGGTAGFGDVVINVVPYQITTTDGTSGQASQVVKTYDSGSNSPVLGDLLTETESDFGTGAPGSVLRTTTNTYMALSGPNASTYFGNNLLDLPYTVEVQQGSGSGTQLSLTQYNYDENTPTSSGLTSSYQFYSGVSAYRGNNTSVLRWLNSGTFSCPNGNSGGSNSYLTSKKTYFNDGMLNTSADPCGNTTTYAYNLTYWGALPTTVTNALGQATTNTYDFNTSMLASTTDPNNLTTTYCSSTFCYDSMWRITEVSHPDGGLDTITHQEVTPPFTATLTSTINSSQNKIKTNVFDGLGRISQTQLTSDPQGTVLTNTTYDALGRVGTDSNPYRSGTDPTSSPGTTTYGYDALNRKITVTYPDGSVLNTAYCYPSTLVTDPTGRWRRSRVDGLGRLVEVDEPNAVGATVNANGCPGTSDPIWVTSYTLDALGNLLQAVQNSSRTRTFTYDSISRLLTATNPESGEIQYTYNPDGPLLTKLDARSITTSYTYDALHRTTGVSYSNLDPSLAFTYDGTGCLGLTTCQNIGHRTGMTDGAGSESWAYEVDKTNLRSIHVEKRTNNSSPSNITKTTTYYLDLAGNVTQLVYPTGRTVNYTYDSADRPSNAADSSNGITYVADWKTPPSSTNCTAGAACYTPQGSVYAMSIGQTSSFTGLNFSESFNNRLQPNQIEASSTAGNAIEITYNFVDPVSSHDAGVVYGITNNLNSNRSQTFTYDQLNRITSAGTSSTTGTYCWGFQYTYDAWANLLSQAGWSPTYNACTETTMGAVTANANNQITGLTYDASGNTLTDGNYTYTWNGESQMKTAGGVTYLYDGDGRRAAKVGTKLYWYGSGGDILSETDASGNTLNDYIFFGGKRVAVVPASGSALYYAEDLLGSARVIVQSNGTLCYDGDFVPFGGERAYTSTCSQNYKFEGKERDTETSNDDFGAREYSWRFGRWLSSDWSATPEPVPYANLSNPQTLNLYGMVEDDPESFADLDGHLGDPPQAASASPSAGPCTDPTLCSPPPPPPPQPTTAAAAAAAPALTNALVESGARTLEIAASKMATAVAGFVGAVAEGTAVAGIVLLTPTKLNSDENAQMAKIHAAEDAAQSGSLPKPPTGPGSVAPDQRDPQRLATPKQKAEKLAGQGGACANCGGKVKAGEGVGHHPVRHADGGKTKDVVIVCKPCHDDLHSSN